MQKTAFQYLESDGDPDSDAPDDESHYERTCMSNLSNYSRVIIRNIVRSELVELFEWLEPFITRKLKKIAVVDGFGFGKTDVTNLSLCSHLVYKVVSVVETA